MSNLALAKRCMSDNIENHARAHDKPEIHNLSVALLEVIKHLEEMDQKLRHIYSRAV